MVLTQSICISGNPVTVGMSIHISSIDQISEVNMVSLKRKIKTNKLFFHFLVELCFQDNGSLEPPEISGCTSEKQSSHTPASFTSYYRSSLQLSSCWRKTDICLAPKKYFFLLLRTQNFEG